MTVQRRKIGTGITQRDTLVLAGDPADVSDTLHAAHAAASPEARCVEIEKTARAILAAAGRDIVPDTLESYARQILRLIQIVRGAVQRSEAAEVERYSYNLGYLVCEANLKFEWETHALRGAEYSQRQSDSAKAKGGSRLDRDLKLLRDYEKRRRNCDGFNGGRSDTRLAEDAGRLCGLKKSGALKAIKRARAHLGKSKKVST